MGWVGGSYTRAGPGFGRGCRAPRKMAQRRGKGQSGTREPVEGAGRSVRFSAMTDAKREGRLGGGIWAHEEPGEAAAELDALMRGLSDVVIVLDGVGRYLKAWSSHPELLIRPAHELVGSTLAEMLPPDVANNALALVRRALEGGRVVHYEYRLPVQVGERSFSASIVPMPGQDRVLWVARDTTSSEEVFQALRESEERYRAAVELSPDAILIHVGASIAFVNQAGIERLGASSRDDIVGRSVVDFVHPNDRPAVAARIQQMLTDGTPVPPTQFRFLRMDGSVAYGESAARPLRLGGRPAILVVVRDLTERVEAEAALRDKEEALRQAQKMEAVGRLAGGIAHDFNNILTAIGGMAELMSGSVSESDPLREDITGIRESVDQAKNLTRQLLAFSRKQIVQPSVVDLNVILRNAERLLRRLIGEDVELVMDLRAELPPVRADVAQLEQVIVNLAINARDAMPSGGRLRIHTALRAAGRGEPAQHVVLGVQDSGEGIPENVLPHIFEPFFTTKAPDRGTGLGLATVYGIVQQAGGRISVESTRGGGTRFEILLPAADPSALAAGDAPET